jgi:hypothetical protein
MTDAFTQRTFAPPTPLANAFQSFPLLLLHS